MKIYNIGYTSNEDVYQKCVILLSSKQHKLRCIRFEINFPSDLRNALYETSQRVLHQTFEHSHAYLLDSIVCGLIHRYIW